jgi:hypothetical protein
MNATPNTTVLSMSRKALGQKRTVEKNNLSFLSYDSPFHFSQQSKTEIKMQKHSSECCSQLSVFSQSAHTLYKHETV